MEVSSNMNLIFLDMEGPLSMQDNTREMMKLFPHGVEIFEIIKRYDSLLAKEGGDYYDPGYGVALAAPFLIHHGISAEDMSQLADRATIVDGACELIAGLKRWRAFCITTSYEQYVAHVMQRVGIQLQNVACTRFPIERYRSLASEEDHALIHSTEEKILSLSRDDTEDIKSCLDRFFKVELPKTSFGLAIKDIKPMGGRRKASALRNFARILGQFPEQVVAVGDSITDSRMLETVDREGGLAIAFNANEHALYYATVGLASTNIGDLKAILDAWEKGGREAVKATIERTNRKGAEPKLQWLADSYDREEVLQLHRKVRQQVRQAAGLSQT